VGKKFRFNGHYFREAMIKIEMKINEGDADQIQSMKLIFWLFAD
jgi:hypothetical protein